MPDWDLSDDPVDFDEAIAAFRKRVPMVDAEWDELVDMARSKAFTGSGVAQLDVISDTWEAIDDAVKNGTGLDDFKASMTESLTTAWAGSVDNPGWRLETIFRTNVQRAYSEGRYEQATDPDTIEDRPFWLFDAILDDATTDVCSECNGTIRPADDGWWGDHLPPLHFNCRSTFVTLTEDEAAEMGGVDAKPTSRKAGDGFGDAPDDDEDDEWEPDKDDYPSEVWNVYRSKTG